MGNEKILLDSAIPNNSNKSKDLKREPKKSPLVQKGGIVSTKPSIGKRLVREFIETDKETIGDYVLKDRLIPGAKNLLLEILEMIFFPGDSSRSHNRRNDYYDRPSYDYSARYRGQQYGGREERNYERDKRREAYCDPSVDYRNVTLKYLADAERVVEDLRYRIRNDGEVSVAYFLDSIGAETSPIDHSWGWTRENEIGLKRNSKGFLIDVNDAHYLG